MFVRRTGNSQLHETSVMEKARITMCQMQTTSFYPYYHHSKYLLCIFFTDVFTMMLCI